MRNRLAIIILSFAVFLGIAFQSAPAASADNQVMGEVEFDAGNKPAKDAGVWVDAEYVGYLKELKGSKKVLLLPGTHEISVRRIRLPGSHRKRPAGTGQKDHHSRIAGEGPGSAVRHGNR